MRRVVRLPSALLLASAVAVPVTACGDPGADTGSLRLEVAVSPTPAAVGPAQVRVRVRDSLDAPVSGARVDLVGTPPAGDRERPVTVTATEARAGLWVADSFPFDVAGDWTLDARAATPDGRRGRRSHPIRVVGASSGGGG